MIDLNVELPYQKSWLHSPISVMPRGPQGTDVGRAGKCVCHDHDDTPFTDTL